MSNPDDKITVTSTGVIENIDLIDVLCPTCGGKGTIPDPQYFGRMMGYCGPNGERSPHCQCRTCVGTGWIKTKRP